MNKPYKRVTPIGYNTGKVMIGGFYIPKPKPMTENEYFIQSIIIGHGLPADMRVKDLWLKFKSMFKKPN